jgi:cytochrome c-type biogenesis protein CcmH/NrfG/rRNA-processing protein FCF1
VSKTFIIDTNVLLADPNVILSFPHADVVIPETVLGELDKLKTARVDPDLRFRGREISRLLFELSEGGSLIEGVELPDGGRLRVAPFDVEGKLPDGYSSRQADDRILATAYQVWSVASPDEEVTLITNDLNMLLKAQTLGVPVRRYGDGVEASFSRRYIIRPFQRYKVPIGILATSVAVFLAIIAVATYTQSHDSRSTDLPAEFKALLGPTQLTAYDAIVTLQKEPNNPEALLSMANFYYGLAAETYSTNRAAVFQYSAPGIRYYERYLRLSPNDNDARADLGTMLFYSGQTDRAIQEVGTVLEKDPNHVNANYNLGIIYWQARRDLKAAEEQMQKVIDLTKNDAQRHPTLQQAQLILREIRQDASSTTSSSAGATQGAVK